MSVAKFSASLAAFIAGQDPDIAYQAADNAIENNAMVTGMLDGQEALALAQCIKDYSDALAKDVAAAISEATEFLKEVSADALEACADYLKANPDNPEIAADMLIGMGIANGDNDNSGILKKGVGKNQAKRQMLITAFKAAPKHMSSAIQKVRGGRSDLHPRVRKINDRFPINAEYAGKVFPLDKLPEALRQKYPHSVPFTGTGHPDFSRYAIKKVEIKVTGIRYKDDALANAASGYTKTPKGYTWHHHHDGKTMQLIPSDIHKAVSHTGGAAVVNAKNN